MIAHAQPHGGITDVSVFGLDFPTLKAYAVRTRHKLILKFFGGFVCSHLHLAAQDYTAESAQLHNNIKMATHCPKSHLKVDCTSWSPHHRDSDACTGVESSSAAWGAAESKGGRERR